MHEPGHGVVSFFSSRRAPSGPFHLLQNMYLQRLWGKRRGASRTHRPGRICRWLTPSLSRLRFTTSSLYAGRVLGGMPLIGTWAHEGPMAFMGLYMPTPSLLVYVPGGDSNDDLYLDAISHLYVRRYPAAADELVGACRPHNTSKVARFGGCSQRLRPRPERLCSFLLLRSCAPL